MKKCLIMMAATMLVAVSGLLADEQEDLQKAAAEINTAAKEPDGQQRVLEAISKETGIPVATLQSQREKTKYGFGELLIANTMASATGKTFDEIVALRDSGKGWGQIAKENNVKLGDILSKAHKANQAAKGKGKCHGKETGAGHGGGKGGGKGSGKGH